jgi:hypothetical protein
MLLNICCYSSSNTPIFRRRDARVWARHALGALRHSEVLARYGEEIMTMLNASSCYRLTLLLDDLISTGSNAPVRVVLQSVSQTFCCTAQISYEQAALLMVKTFREPIIIRDHLNALLNYKLVELLTAADKPHLFSLHALSEIGIHLDFKPTL